MKKEKNSFDTTVEMFKDQGADCLFLSNFKYGMVCGVACNNKTGMIWEICMISSIEEALGCKYLLACKEDDKKLVKYLEKHRKPQKK